jgi:hypothetical protein
VSNKCLQPANIAVFKPLHGYLGFIHAILRFLCWLAHKIYTMIFQKVGGLEKDLRSRKHTTRECRDERAGEGSSVKKTYNTGMS